MPGGSRGQRAGACGQGAAMALLVSIIGAMAACAASTVPAGPVPQVAGTWEGRINPEGEVLGQQSLPAGLVRLELSQRGNWVNGSLSGPGFSGAISATLHGTRLSGSFDGQPLGGPAIEVSATIDGAFKDDTLRAVLDGNGRMTLKRLR
jgi:hypothetical protein